MTPALPLVDVHYSDLGGTVTFPAAEDARLTIQPNKVSRCEGVAMQRVATVIQVLGDPAQTRPAAAESPRLGVGTAEDRGSHNGIQFHIGHVPEAAARCMVARR